MILRTEHLVILNNKNRVQHVLLQLEQKELGNTFCIHRTTGQYGCKNIIQPDLNIEYGKGRRTASEQAALQFNGLLKNYLNKGYKRLIDLTVKPYESLLEHEIKSLLGETFTTDTNGIPKPMLCKLYDDCTGQLAEKCWFVSRKLDGVRALFYYKNGEIHTASRGGRSYDPATTHLRHDPALIAIFEKHPDLILDGELYKHDINFPLQRLSGLARLDTWNEECGNLEYWVYDYVSQEPFSQRYETLMEFRSLLPENSKIKIIDHEYICGLYKIRRRHDQYVREGFEGLVMRNPDKEYGVNKRSSKYMVKMKDRKSEEFTIVDVKEGLRPEDMCFILKTEEGKQFAAKPIGPAEARLEYLYNAGKFIGKKATCTFFYYSNDGTPLQPVFQHVRADDE
jgi:hypothetical protein